MRKRSLLLGDSISKWNIDFQVDSHLQGCEGRVLSDCEGCEMRKRSLLLGDWIYKLNLNLKAVKAEFSDEKEKFSSWWFNFQVEYWISSWISMWRLWRPSVKAVRWEREV
jgi:hypothetical protein